MIELDRLHRYFGDTKAVCDVSFAVAAGEVFGYIGPNGAGKTTSMRILATLDLPSTGDARVDGFSVVDDPDRVRRRLGFMPDGFGTYPHMNVWEYLDFFARSYGLRGQERGRAVARVMEFTLLGSLRNKAIDALSKGMKQRLCLGRALIHDPGVLVLDEPAAGLDPRARIELREMISHLAAAGKAVLVSSHILTELAEMCHTVGILEQGRLLAVGPVEAIRKQLQPEAAVRLEVLGDPRPVADWLEGRDDVGQVQVVERCLRFQHQGNRQAEAELLRAMIEQGFAVVEFSPDRQSLEDVFLQVTEGRVQ